MNLSGLIELHPDLDIPPRIPMGGDMSEARVSPPILLGKVRVYDVTLIWPESAGAARPTGSFGIWENGSQSDNGWGLIPECSSAAFVGAQPSGNGAAGCVTLRGLETGAMYVRIIWTPDSGGTGVIPEVYISFKAE